MTHPTDEELHATESVGNLAHHLRRMADNIACDQIDADRLNRAADALTAMRAKIAEMNADRDAVAEGRDMMGRLWETEKARADRAEAELAAQIEADAGLIDSITAEAAKGILLGSAQDRAVLDMMKSLSAAIRTQPHDRSALDRMLAEAREKTLREAAEMVRGTAYTSSNVGCRLEPVSPAMAGMDMHHATIADAILAMIDKP